MKDDKDSYRNVSPMSFIYYSSNRNQNSIYYREYAEYIFVK